MTAALARVDIAMMDPVHEQYEAYPYPARDPADEDRRLISGSPSHPVEIDHFLFGGRRDWTRPFRALVAGGGTGDGLIMLAQTLRDIGCPAEITYLDLSRASRAIAEARAARRGLDIRFVTGDLSEAPSLGPFEYVDCCGVLHHLPDPDAGFRALAGAVTPEGGIGLMVYAPYGRTGVYPMQSALRRLTEALGPEDQLARARAVLEALPETNQFRGNALLGDHRASDAGLFDLLLHARDRAYTVEALTGALARAGLSLVGFVEPLRYDPARYLPPGTVPRGMTPVAAAALAEELAGNMKTHIAYVAPTVRQPARPTKPDLVAHLTGADPGALARQIRAKGRVTVTLDGLGMPLEIPREAGPLIARIDGTRPLGQIADGQDWMAFAALWAPVHRTLGGVNLLHYSAGARR